MRRRTETEYMTERLPHSPLCPTFNDRSRRHLVGEIFESFMCRPIRRCPLELAGRAYPAIRALLWKGNPVLLLIVQMLSLMSKRRQPVWSEPLSQRKREYGTQQGENLPSFPSVSCTLQLRLLLPFFLHFFQAR